MENGAAPRSIRLPFSIFHSPFSQLHCAQIPEPRGELGRNPQPIVHSLLVARLLRRCAFALRFRHLRRFSGTIIVAVPRSPLALKRKMPRSIWKGAITFGLVNIPVEVHSAVSSSDRISFRLLHKKDNSTIKYDRVCVKEEKSVPYDEIVKGYEYSKGKFVVLEDEDFRAAAIESTKTIEIQDFVKNDEI